MTFTDAHCPDSVTLQESDLVQLEAILAAATKLPWLVDDDTHVEGGTDEDNSLLAGFNDLEEDMRGEFYDAADAELTVAAVNALPKLIAALREARTELAKAQTTKAAPPPKE